MTTGVGSRCANITPHVLLYAMTRERSLFDESDPAAEAAADARADADMREGRLISHEAVKRWIRSWGTDKPLPRPRVGD